MDMANKKEIAVVYMVAGLSSRFGGKIKQFARVGPKDETLIEYSINQALKGGFNKIIFIVGEKTEENFKKMFGSRYNNLPVLYAKQNFESTLRDRPWGTADAICSAKDILKPLHGFVICNGDDIYGTKTFKQMAEHLRNPENKSIGASIGYKLSEVLPEIGASNRGIFELDDEGNILDIQEKFNIVKNNLSALELSEDDLCSMNIFALNHEVVEKLYDILIEFKEKNKSDRRIECLLPVELSNLIKRKELTMKIYKTEDRWFGVTNPDDEEIVREELKRIQMN